MAEILDQLDLEFKFEDGLQPFQARVELASQLMARSMLLMPFFWLGFSLHLLPEIRRDPEDNFFKTEAFLLGSFSE